MAKKKFQILHSRPFVFLTATLLKAYFLTLRLKVENEAPWVAHLDSGGRVLLCSWHQQFFPFVCYFKKFKKYQPSVMISRSNDGEFIARVAQAMAWHPVRGSSSKGGSSALKQIIGRIKEYQLGAQILDGPRGPIGKVKPGAIYMAMHASACIVPVYAYPENAWFFRKSWDQFFVPKPFSKVTIRYGDMIDFTQTDDSSLMENYRKQLEDTMSPALNLVDKQ